MALEFRILGPLEVRDGNCQLDVRGAKQRLLLGILLLHANEVMSSDALIDAMWGDEPPETAHKALQMHISQLRKVLEPERTVGKSGTVIVTRRPGYLLRVEPGQFDLTRFERALREAANHMSPRETVDRLREALALWRGSALADLAAADALRGDAARLDELRLGAIEDRIDAELALAGHARVIGELETLVAQEPLRERLRVQLMLALYRSGRQAEALAVYRDTRRALVDELGIEPGRQLRELHGSILRQDQGLDLAAAATPRVETRRDGFVGREAELAALVGGLDDAAAGSGRLFMLAGEPGIGKSRLAEELAECARGRGARMLTGRCWEAGGAPVYWPWVQALRAHVRETDDGALRAQLGAGAAELAQIVPELRQRFPELPPPSPVEREGGRVRLFDAVAELLRAAARPGPIVLVLDDLHAADEPSLLLLRFVTRELGSIGMLIIGAYRDVAPAPEDPLTELLAELSREPIMRRLSLGGLSEPEVARYLELTASAASSPALAATLREKTEGNPLFIGEIVRLLAVEADRSPSRDAPQLAIPQSVRDVIARRLTYLTEECNRVMLLASVLGREFAVDV